VAFAVKATTRVVIPVPNAPYPITGFIDLYIKPQFTQFKELVHTGNAGAHHDGSLSNKKSHWLQQLF